MSVYVDDMQMYAEVPNGSRTVKARWSHMFADTLEELEQMARCLKLKPEWRQDHRKEFPHYDLVESKRVLAIRLGAKAVSWLEIPEFAKKIERVT